MVLVFIDYATSSACCNEPGCMLSDSGSFDVAVKLERGSNRLFIRVACLVSVLRGHRNSLE